VGGGSESLPSLRSQIGVADAHGVRPLPERNAKPFEHQVKSVSGNAEGARQRLESLPGFVTTDRVIHVERKGCDEAFDGDDAAYGPCHVYNLQTRDGYYVANGIVVSNCRPPKNNLSATPLAVGHCSPNVERTIRELQPKVIILLGGTAVKSVIGRLWKGEDPGGVGRWVGWRIPAHAENAWVCATYHPSFLLHMKEKKQQDSRKVHERLFRRHLKAALNKAGSRPWPDGPPDYPGRVEIVMDPAEAARRLRRYTSGTVAFDYENDRLKPDHAEGRFICASVCWNGAETIAFPWRGEVVEAMKTLLADPDVGKIASNLKHEHRWTLARLGVRVRNWAWDTMLAAHAADSRGGISSIKFQAFVKLGQPDYAHHISEFLRPRDESREGGYAQNQVHTVPMDLILKYCGLDSLLEYEVAKLQMKELGVN
jgi:uracil-DNA glycosylase family 4